jgi:hypothetical protein
MVRNTFLVILLLLSNIANADFYLSGGFGMHISRWHDEVPSRDTVKCTGLTICEIYTNKLKTYLGHKNPLGRIRLGYEHNFNKVVSIDTYAEHTSSVPTKKERGLNVIMLEGKINLSELFR